MENTQIQYQARHKISHLILEHVIYAIILIGVHRTYEPLMLYFIDHSKWSYQYDYLISFVDCITCLQKVLGDHCVFVITVQKYKCSILKLVILRLDQYH